MHRLFDQRTMLAVCLFALPTPAGALEPSKSPGLVTTAPATGRSVETSGRWMVPYTETIPGTDLNFEMLPVPGGVVQLPVGTADGEPVYCEVMLPPFWVAKCEVTWAEYRKYMALDTTYAKLQQLATLRSEPKVKKVLRGAPQLANLLTAERSIDGSAIEVDAVTAPTPLYDPSTTYESGEDAELPAVTMTPFAARQYTKWLTALTGRDYRLPSEAEWLHAATAGEPINSEVADDSIDAIAWYADNSDYVAQHVGTKAANAWGLHDVLGNAAELVLDAYRPDGRLELSGKRIGWREAVAWPTKGDARIAKGGWYDAEAEEIDFVHRMATNDDDWKGSDPNLPSSPWWYSDYPATGVGFRLVRQLEPIADELKTRVWDTDDSAVTKAVSERLREGRGKIGPIGPDLPGAVEDLQSNPVRKLLK